MGGRRFAGVFFTEGRCVVAPAWARALAAAFFFAAGVFAAGATAPDDTRDECFVRWRVFFGVAPSAIDDSANAATSATTSVLSVLRIMGRYYNKYASANPICATNIMRYMCAHDTWFSSTARSSGRRSIR